MQDIPLQTEVFSEKPNLEDIGDRWLCIMA